jgi:uncharacterized sporulation protein YeaH/YhbH (DUF444 family)
MDEIAGGQNGWTVGDTNGLHHSNFNSNFNMQHFTYIEITNNYFWSRRGSSNLWETIEDLEVKHPNLSMGEIEDEKQVITVFRNLFKKERTA